MHRPSVSKDSAGRPDMRIDKCRILLLKEEAVPKVRRWWRQYVDAVRNVDPRMEQLKTWLERNIPSPDATTAPSTITHGDFSLNNLIFSKEAGCWTVRAIVDWELSTLVSFISYPFTFDRLKGDGWADVAYACLPYYVPRSNGLPPPLLPYTDGIPSESTCVRRYASARGIQMLSSRDWAFYKALALFRLASICQGVGARAAQGNAASDRASSVGSVETIARLILRGLEIAKGGSDASISDFDFGGYSMRDDVRQLIRRLDAFLHRYVFPLESEMDARSQSEARWTPHPKLEACKLEAKKWGLWNLFISREMAGHIDEMEGLLEEDKKALSGWGLTNLEYGFLAESMGRCLWASEVFNCQAPDTGNMEILAKYINNSMIQNQSIVKIWI